MSSRTSVIKQRACKPGGVHIRVFNIDIETCSECGGAVKIIACIEDPVVIQKILDHLQEKAALAGLDLRPPCRAPPQLV